MAAEKPKFLGRGWQFPPRFEVALDEQGRAAAAGTAAMVANNDDIQESLRILLATSRGERVMRPQYGLGLHEHVFDLSDETSLGDLRSKIEDAVLHFEPRIVVEEIYFDTSTLADGYLSVLMQYWIPAINSRSNIVFPFYFDEGTSLPLSMRLQGSEPS